MHAQVDILAELLRERAVRQSLEEQLATALNVNAEMKLALILNDEEGGHSLLAKKVSRLSIQVWVAAYSLSQAST